MQRVWYKDRDRVRTEIRKAIEKKKGYRIRYGVFRRDGKICIVDSVVKYYCPEENCEHPFLRGTVRVLSIINPEEIEKYNYDNI